MHFCDILRSLCGDYCIDCFDALDKCYSVSFWLFQGFQKLPAVTQHWEAWFCVKRNYIYRRFNILPDVL